MDAIPYKLTVEDREGYLYVCVESDAIDLDMVIDYINAYARALRETGHTRMLFEQCTPVLAQAGKYSIAAMIAKNMLPAGARVAVVDNSDAPAVTNGSINQQAVAAGVDAKQFRSMEPALKWLLN